jgi:hypothetical protein
VRSLVCSVMLVASRWRMSDGAVRLVYFPAQN